ncbi:hypothetical protein [Brucella pecoris]|uniref:Uncharacterized protein n=1 Tax=Brucella pecoris TaxID=867683 RepID=A0AB34YMF1_9HYPH|nr:hypothetical protein [Brucella pecoris]MBB4091940.1 hypothetical protein [Brucella pecoris]
MDRPFFISSSLERFQLKLVSQEPLQVFVSPHYPTQNRFALLLEML